MTKLEIVNHAEPATFYITLGAAPGCCQDVGKLIMSNDVVIVRSYPLQGYFFLAHGASVTMAAPDGEGLNGNISINTPPPASTI